MSKNNGKYDPHAVYEVYCRICNYKWVAVVPIKLKIKNIECPRCGNMSGELR